MPPPASDQDRARIRDNQRRLRAKRKEYQQELEDQLSQCKRQGVGASAEVQAAARKVAGENKKLRTLLNQHGVDHDSIEAYLQSPATEPGPSAVETLETLLGPRRPSCLDPDVPFCPPEPRGRSGDGSMESEQDQLASLTCIATPPSPWNAALLVQTGGLAPPSGATSVASSSGADATILPTNLEVAHFTAEDAAASLAGLQPFVYDPVSQHLQSLNPAPGTSTTSYHAHQPQFPLPTTAQPPASLLSIAGDSSLLAAAGVRSAMGRPAGERDLGIVSEPYDASTLAGSVNPYLEYE